MTILSGWREQYDRMCRSHDHLSTVAGGHGNEHVSSPEARDALIHFFQDAWHLKDWLKNDDRAVSAHLRSTIEADVKKRPTLQLCADIANGTKHFRRDPKKYPPRTGFADTAITSQDVTVRPGTAGSGIPAQPALHAWRITSGGKVYDAVPLADDVVHEWEQWLQANGLL